MIGDAHLYHDSSTYGIGYGSGNGTIPDEPVTLVLRIYATDLAWAREENCYPPEPWQPSWREAKRRRERVRLPNRRSVQPKRKCAW